MSKISPFNLVLISSIVWAIQPVVILLLGESSPSRAASFLILNNIALAVIGFGVSRAMKPLQNVVRLWQRTKNKGFLAGLLLLDAAFAGASYWLLILASADGTLATHAIIFESWPIFVMLMLYVILPKENDLTVASTVAIFVFIAGFAFLNADAFTADDIFQIKTYLSLISAILMGAAVVSMQVLLKHFGAFRHARIFPIIIGFRGLLTCVVVGTPFLFHDFDFTTDQATTGFVLLSVGVGVLVAINQITYHIGTSKSQTNSVALIALFSPVLAPLLLVVLGRDLPTSDFFIGAAFIVAGLALAHREGDNSIQFVALVLSILVTGALVHYTTGSADAQFFSYLNITSLFYALLQTSSFSRLWTAQQEMERHGRAVLLALPRRRNPTVRDSIRDDINFLKSYGRSNATVSELVLLTVLAGSNIVILIATRENTLLGNSIAFLVSVTSAFLITYCWHMQIRIFSLSRKIYDPSYGRTQISHLKNRLINVVFLISLFIYFVGIIFLRGAA